MSVAIKPAPDARTVQLAQFMLAALMRDVPFPKRLHKLEKLEDQSYRTLTAAVGRSNVYPINLARVGKRPDEMDAERTLKRDLANAILHAIDTERRVIASYGFPSPGYPVPDPSR